MGKIRIKTIGDESLENKQKKENKKRIEIKKAEKKETQAVEVTENSLSQPQDENVESKIVKKVKHEKKEQKEFHSQKYLGIAKLVDNTKKLSISDALDGLEKLQRKSFDETVELHLNTTSIGLSGNVILPNGTGKKTRVAIADDALISEIEKGIISFDILVAEPAMMPKLARVAKVLGPRGLMPNPKNGTISQNPQEVAKKYSGGQINFKTEAKSPIMHLTVGKMSFGKEKLTQNIQSLLTSVKKSNIVNATLKSTMSPGIKIEI